MSVHTPGPWAWTLNPKTKSVELCRGYHGDIVMGFARWGMGSATPVFRSNGIMKRAVDFAVVQPGREHHAEWWRLIDHPDASLIAAAPDLLEAAEGAVFEHEARRGECNCGMCEPLKAAIAKAKGRP